MNKKIKRLLCGICIVASFGLAGCEFFGAPDTTGGENSSNENSSNENSSGGISSGEEAPSLEIFEGNYREVELAEITTFLNKVTYTYPEYMQGEILLNAGGVAWGATWREYDFEVEEEVKIRSSDSIIIDKYKYQVKSKEQATNTETTYASTTKASSYYDGENAYVSVSQEIRNGEEVVSSSQKEKVNGIDGDFSALLFYQTQMYCYTGASLDQLYNGNRLTENEYEEGHVHLYGEQYENPPTMTLRIDDTDETYTKIKIDVNVDSAWQDVEICPTGEHDVETGSTGHKKAEASNVLVYTKDDYKLLGMYHLTKSVDHTTDEELGKITLYAIPFDGEITPPSDLDSYESDDGSNNDGDNDNAVKPTEPSGGVDFEEIIQKEFPDLNGDNQEATAEEIETFLSSGDLSGDIVKDMIRTFEGTDELVEINALVCFEENETYNFAAKHGRSRVLYQKEREGKTVIDQSIYCDGGYSYTLTYEGETETKTKRKASQIYDVIFDKLPAETETLSASNCAEYESVSWNTSSADHIRIDAIKIEKTTEQRDGVEVQVERVYRETYVYTEEAQLAAFYVEIKEYVTLNDELIDENSFTCWGRPMSGWEFGWAEDLDTYVEE